MQLIYFNTRRAAFTMSISYLRRRPLTVDSKVGMFWATGLALTDWASSFGGKTREKRKALSLSQGRYWYQPEKKRARNWEREAVACVNKQKGFLYSMHDGFSCQVAKKKPDREASWKRAKYLWDILPARRAKLFSLVVNKRSLKALQVGGGVTITCLSRVKKWKGENVYWVATTMYVGDRERELACAHQM